MKLKTIISLSVYWSLFQMWAWVQVSSSITRRTNILTSIISLIYHKLDFTKAMKYQERRKALQLNRNLDNLVMRWPWKPLRHQAFVWRRGINSLEDSGKFRLRPGKASSVCVGAWGRRVPSWALTRSSSGTNRDSADDWVVSSPNRRRRPAPRSAAIISCRLTRSTEPSPWELLRMLRAVVKETLPLLASWLIFTRRCRVTAGVKIATCTLAATEGYIEREIHG